MSDDTKLISIILFSLIVFSAGLLINEIKKDEATLKAIEHGAKPFEAECAFKNRKGCYAHKIRCKQ